MIRDMLGSIGFSGCTLDVDKSRCVLLLHKQWSVFDYDPVTARRSFGRKEKRVLWEQHSLSTSTIGRQESGRLTDQPADEVRRSEFGSFEPTANSY